MARGRVRSVGGHRRIALDTGWQLAATAPGAITAIAGVDTVTGWVAGEVPGTAASSLRAIRRWTWDETRHFDAEDWWWRTRFTRPHGSGAGGAPIVLGLDGLASLSDVWLNGTRIAGGDSMFVAHEVRIDALLRDGDDANELVIRCRALEPELARKRPRPRWKVPMLVHQQLRWVRTTLLGRTPGWSPPAAAVGPWRPVWIETRPGVEVGDVQLDADVVDGDGVVEIAAELAGAESTESIESVTLVIARGEHRVRASLARTDGRWRGAARIADPARWWPHTHGEPARYATELEVTTRGAAPVAIDLGAIGFRTIEVERAAGEFRVRVNGVPVFCRGACWTPLDAVSLDATPAASRASVAQARDAGMNMLRIGGTMVYELDAVYDAMDELGILLWQDLMFANMDYPDDDAFAAVVATEVDQQLARLQARPSLAIVCGNSEGEQQAAMFGATPDRWAPPLFHVHIPALVAARCPDVAYTPSSTHGGAFPHAANAGATSYYGVGAYLRPLDDARRAEVKFASECLAFANIPAASGLSGGGGAALRVHHAMWAARAPRDLGAGWDFDDVRDHYVQRLFGVDPFAVRLADHDRYLALGRVATGEVMAQVFGEWRRARSTCGGGLVWFLRDLWPGAGWGVVDAHGVPKPCWYALRRALAPIAIAITDEGVNGLALHVSNDRGVPLAARIELVMWRAGEIEVGRGTHAIEVPAHGAIELAAAALFEGFVDLSYAYRFGPPAAHVIHVQLLAADGAPLADAFWFPAGMPSTRELDVGLTATAEPATADRDDLALTIRTRRFAQAVSIDAAGYQPDDDNFHLAPGQARTVRLRRLGVATAAPVRGHVTALNADATARIEPHAAPERS